MSRVHVADRKPSKLATEENALELARQIRELDYIRNFGFKVRMVKTPRNWDEWSTDAKAAWVLREADKLDRLRRLDETYLAQKRREVERDVKKLLHNITAGNSYKRPKCIEEANRRLMCQDAAIEACNELYTDLQDIMDTLPIDKNWMVQIEPLIDRELALLHGWRNGDAAMRKAVYAAEANRGRLIVQQWIDDAIQNTVLSALQQALGIYDPQGRESDAADHSAGSA